jgi:hypothetical protein
MAISFKDMRGYRYSDAYAVKFGEVKTIVVPADRKRAEIELTNGMRIFLTESQLNAFGISKLIGYGKAPSPQLLYAICLPGNDVRYQIRASGTLPKVKAENWLTRVDLYCIVKDYFVLTIHGEHVHRIVDCSEVDIIVEGLSVRGLGTK